MRSDNTALRVLAAMLSLALCGCRGRPVTPVVSEADLERIAKATELDLQFSYDPESGLVAFANNVGTPGIFLLDSRHPAVPELLPIEQEWPRRVALSPGGKWLAYHELVPAELTYERRLYLMHLPTKKVQLVWQSEGKERVFNASFSPDGKTLAYQRSRLHAEKWTYELWTRDLASGAERRVFLSNDNLPWASWAGDSAFMYFNAGECVRALRLDDSTFRDVACTPGGSTLRDPPEVSPDGHSLAYAVETADCTRLVRADLGTSTWAFVDAKICGSRPVWRLGPRPGLAYIEVNEGSRLPRLRSLAEGGVTSGLGVDTGVVYQMAPTPDGSLIVLMSTLGLSRSLWLIDPAQPASRKLLFSPLDPELTARTSIAPETVWLTSKDGLRVPMLVFPGLRQLGKRAAALLFVHGGPKEDVSPRWEQEISYMAAAGLTVAAVNYRGSTGYGVPYRNRSEDLLGQVEDLRAARRAIASRPDVDPTRVFLLAISVGGDPAAALLRSTPTEYRGVSQWWGDNLPAGFDQPSDSVHARPEAFATLPPLFWVHGRGEKLARAFAERAKRLTAAGWVIDRLELPKAAHYSSWADERALALQRLRQFVTR